MASLGLVFSKHPSPQIAFLSGSFINCLLRLIVSEFRSNFLPGQNYEIWNLYISGLIQLSSQQFSYRIGKYISNFILTDRLSIITSWILLLFLVPFVIISSPMHAFAHILWERVMSFTKVSALGLSLQAGTRLIEIIVGRTFPEH